MKSQEGLSQIHKSAGKLLGLAEFSCFLLETFDKLYHVFDFSHLLSSEVKMRQADIQKRLNEAKRKEKEEKNEKLIKAVRPYTCLYDKADSAHSDDITVQRKWEAVAREVGEEDVDQVKKDWRYLRNIYTKKRKEAGITGSSGDAGDDSTNTVSWPHLNSLRFLDPYLRGRG